MEFELLSFFNFLRQAGWAVAGAAALWGFVFTVYAHRKKGTTDEVVFRWLSHRLFWLFSLASVASITGWFLGRNIVYAHEGIILVPTTAEFMKGFEFLSPIFSVWVIFFAFSLALRLFNNRVFDIFLPYIFGAHFILISILISVIAWTEGFNNQLFFVGHNFHSIMTVGTVIVLDFLFLSSKKSLHLKQNIFPLFPTISKVIWVGLAIDFMSVALVFSEAIALTPKFYFVQTVIGILIINGALMSGPLTDMMLKTVKKDRKPLSKRQVFMMDVAGTVSITSWLTITFVDFFYNLSFSYVEFLSMYLITILVLFVGHHLWERFDRSRSLPFQLDH